MHVLIIPSWYPAMSGDIGGSFFREQAQALSRAGCRVGVIYPQLRSMRQWRSGLFGRYGIAVEDDDGVNTLRYHDMSWFPKMPALRARYWMWRGRRLYAEYVKNFGTPDIIHAHSLLCAGCLAHDLMKKKEIPYVVTEHSSAYGRGLVGQRLARMAGRAVQGAARTFAVSRAMCQLLEHRFDGTDAHWQPMPNIVSEQFLHVPLSKAEHKDGVEIVFLHVSMLDTKKAVDNLIRAFSQAFVGDERVRLKIGGDGPGREKLEALAKELGASQSIQFLGSLTRQAVVREMAACDVFVLSSHHEPFGVVLIEALAVGKPVIATRSGGPESIVREQDGVLVPVNDVAGLGKAMSHMRKNHLDYSAPVIREGCRSRFSSEAVNRRLINEYRDVLVEVASTNPDRGR